MRSVALAGLLAACSVEPSHLLDPPAPVADTGEVRVALTGSLDGDAYVIFGDASGALLDSRAITPGREVAIERDDRTTVTLATFTAAGRCRSLYTFDRVAPDRTLTFEGAPRAPAPESIEALLVAHLPWTPPGVTEIWVGSGCGGGDVSRERMRFESIHHCFPAGREVDVVAVAHGPAGEVLGHAILPAGEVHPFSRVEVVLPSYEAAVVEHALALRGFPSGATSGMLTLTGFDPDGRHTVRLEHPFSPGAAPLSLQLPPWPMAVRASLLLWVHGQPVRLRTLDAAALADLPEQIDLGGDLPVVSDVVVTVRARPKIEWTVAGEGEARGVYAKYAWQPGRALDWSIISTAEEGVVLPELPGALADCRPTLEGPTVDVRLFDGPDRLFEQWRLDGQPPPFSRWSENQR